MIIPLPKEEKKSPSQHWYTMQAEACHWQEDGKQTNLRHARKQNLVPSVSGVLNLIEKPRITKFKCDEMVKQCLQYPHEEGESEKDYINRIHGYAKAAKRDILDFGTRVHHGIEMYNLGTYDEQEDPDIFPYVETYIRWAQKNVKKVIAVEKTVVNKKLGYGGTIDLVAELRNQRGVTLIDYKTQRWDDEKKPAFYETWPQQLAAYRKTMKPNPHCLSLVICATEPRPVIERWWSKPELQTAWKIFNAARVVWQESKNYRPSNESDQQGNI